MIHIDLGTVEAILPPEEQVPGEDYSHGSRLRVYVTSVSKGTKGPQITVSRTHPGLVRKLFALEVRLNLVCDADLVVGAVVGNIAWVVVAAIQKPSIERLFWCERTWRPWLRTCTVVRVVDLEDTNPLYMGASDASLNKDKYPCPASG